MDDKKKDKKEHRYERELRESKKTIETYLFPLYKKSWKAYLKDNSDRKQFLKDWETNIFSSMTQKSIDVMFASLYDAQTGYNVSGRNGDGVRNEANVRTYMDYLYEVSQGKRALEFSAFDSFVVGSGFLKVKWKEQKRYVTRISGGQKKNYVFEDTKRPIVCAVSPFNIFFDVRSADIKDSYVYETHYITKKEASRQFLGYYNVFLAGEEGADGEATEDEFLSYLESKMENEEEVLDKKGNSQKAYTFTNHDLIKQRVLMVKAMEAEFESVFGTTGGLHNSLTQGSKQTSGTALSTITTGGVLIRDEKGACEFAERWDDGDVSILCNGRYLFTAKNVMPTGENPYFQTFYKRLPHTMLGTGISYSIQDAQMLDNMIRNLGLDSAKIYGVPSFKRVRNAMSGDMYDGDEVLDISPGRVFSVGEKDELTPLISASGAGNISILQTKSEELDREAKESIGLNEYVLGSQGKVERSAAAVQTLLESFKMRLRPFISSVNDAFAGIARAWLVMTLAWADERIPVAVLGEDNRTSITNMTLEDLQGEYKYSFEIDGMSSVTKELEKEMLTQLMPVLIKMLYDPKTQEPLVDPKKFLVFLLRRFDLDISKIMNDSIPDVDSTGQNAERFLSDIIKNMPGAFQQPVSEEQLIAQQGHASVPPAEGQVDQMAQAVPADTALAETSLQ